MNIKYVKGVYGIQQSLELSLMKTAFQITQKMFDKYVEQYPRGQKGKDDWDKYLSEIKLAGKNKKYDCIIGVSGGTDSSYLMHLAIKQGLRPLAVTLDNGWSSDVSVQNIKKCY